MKIKDVMTTKVAFINLDTTLEKAAEKMKREEIGALPVVNPTTERIEGMLTDRDIVIRGVAEGKDLGQTPARDVMTEKIRYVFEDEDLTVGANQMKENQIRRLVVLNRQKRLVGMLTLADIACRGGDEKISGNVLRGVCSSAA